MQRSVHVLGALVTTKNGTRSTRSWLAFSRLVLDDYGWPDVLSAGNGF
jgi:hypothetical protein